MAVDNDTEIMSFEKSNLDKITDDDSLNNLRANCQARERLLK